MKDLFPFILLCILFGCVDRSEQTRRDYFSNDMQYFKDNRTKLCFAGFYLGAPSGSMTNVPCTPEVEQEILLNRHRP